MTQGTRNQGLVYHARVAEDEAGQGVVEFHVRRFRHTGREEWLRRLAAGSILVNGRIATGDMALAAGDRLEFHREGWEEPPVPQSFGVVHEDEDVLVVDKPAGLQVLPGGPFHVSTLLAYVRASAPDRCESAPAHRLGRGTSGLILFGKSARARTFLACEFRAHRVRKTYLAWVEGTTLPLSMRAEQPIGSRPHGPTDVACVTPRGKPSLTRLRVLARDLLGQRSLIAAQPISGRPNQIRVHAAASGAALVGDPLYGPGGLPKSDATPGAGGYYLHAAALALRHPRDGRWLKLRSLPAWLAREVDRRTPDS